MRRGAATVALLLAALVAIATSRSPAATFESEARAPTPLTLSLHPKNPKYLRFRGRATLLVTSGEHYGAVVNRDFDFTAYLRQLAAHRFNLTRLFSGSYVETPDFIQGRGHHNPLAPAAGRLLAPWARSSTPGYANGGPRFDLSRWNPSYFSRLKSFVRAAGRHGIVVEVVLFSAYYTEANWRFSPLHSANNVNGVGDVPLPQVYDLERGDRRLLAAQVALARKLVRELQPFDNVYLEVLNEPYWVPCAPAGDCAVLGWQEHMISTIADAQRLASRKHLIAQNVADRSARVATPNPRVSIFNFHHALPEAVTANAHLRRPIANDETGFQGGDPFPYRREAWRFVLAGGTVVSNLDWSFAPRYERGTLSTLDFRYGGGGPALRRQLSILKRFVHGFPLLRLLPSPDVASPDTEGAVVDVLADPGRAYAVYLSGRPASKLRLLLPVGRYRGTWTSTTTGAAIRRVTFTAGDETVLTVPPYREDIALDLRRNSGSS